MKTLIIALTLVISVCATIAQASDSFINLGLGASKSHITGTIGLEKKAASLLLANINYRHSGYSENSKPVLIGPSLLESGNAKSVSNAIDLSVKIKSSPSDDKFSFVRLGVSYCKTTTTSNYVTLPAKTSSSEALNGLFGVGLQHANISAELLYSPVAETDSQNLSVLIGYRIGF